MIRKPINIILHVEINYNSFKEDYQKKFLDKIDLDEIAAKIDKDYDLPDIDRLIFNGGWNRNFYYLVGNVLHKTEIYIRKLNCFTVDGDDHYVSVWPHIVIKYNPLSVDLIEHISINIRKGEGIFLEGCIEDPDIILDCEDFLHNYCFIVEIACELNQFAASLNSKYTKNFNSVLQVNKDSFYSMRYPAIYLLHKTGQAYFGTQEMVLSRLNLIFNFLR